MASTVKVLVRLWPLWLALLTAVIGLRYDWQLALGGVWFGLSLVALIWAVRSFRPGTAARFPESK